MSKIISSFEIHRLSTLIKESSDPGKVGKLRKDLAKYCRENNIDFKEVCDLLKIDTAGVEDIPTRVIEIIEEAHQKLYYGSSKPISISLEKGKKVINLSGDLFRFNKKKELLEIFSEFKFGKIEGNFEITSKYQYSSSDQIEEGDLKGKMPSEVTGNFLIDSIKIESLEDISPQKIGGDLRLENTRLENLKGAPSEVGSFIIDRNNPVSGKFSLEGSPEEVKSFTIKNTPLSTFKNGPKKISGDLRINDTNLESFIDSGIEEIKGSLYLSDNKIFSLEGIPLQIMASNIETNKNLFPPAMLKETFRWAQAYGSWVAAYLKLSTTERFKRMGKAQRDPIRERISPENLRKNSIGLSKIWKDEEIMGDNVVKRLIKKAGIEKEDTVKKDIELSSDLEDLGF